MNWPDGARVTILGSVVATITNLVSTNITQWLGSTAPTVGAKTGAQSIPVVLSSDNIYFMPSTALGAEPALTSNVLIKNGTGTLWSIYAGSMVAQDIWLMTFDAVALPANGTAPLDYVQIPRHQSGEAGIFIPRVYTNGIFVAASTTHDVLTLAAGAPLLLRARYT